MAPLGVPVAFDLVVHDGEKAVRDGTLPLPLMTQPGISPLSPLITRSCSYNSDWEWNFYPKRPSDFQLLGKGE